MGEYNQLVVDSLKQSQAPNPHYQELRRLLQEVFTEETEADFVPWMKFISDRYGIDQLVDIGGGSGCYSHSIMEFIQPTIIERYSTDSSGYKCSFINVDSDLLSLDISELHQNTAMLNEVLHLKGPEYNHGVINNLQEQGIDYIIVGENLPNADLSFRLRKLTDCGRLYSQIEMAELFADCQYRLVGSTLINSMYFHIYQQTIYDI